MPLPKIKDIVKDNTARFSFYRNGNCFYEVSVHETSEPTQIVPTKSVRYVFPVDIQDLGGASVFAEEKAITLMRYIRKALKDKTFVRAA